MIIFTDKIVDNLHKYTCIRKNMLANHLFVATPPEYFEELQRRHGLDVKIVDVQFVENHMSRTVTAHFTLSKPSPKKRDITCYEDIPSLRNRYMPDRF